MSTITNAPCPACSELTCNCTPRDRSKAIIRRVQHQEPSRTPVTVHQALIETAMELDTLIGVAVANANEDRHSCKIWRLIDARIERILSIAQMCPIFAKPVIPPIDRLDRM